MVNFLIQWWHYFYRQLQFNTACEWSAGKQDQIQTYIKQICQQSIGDVIVGGVETDVEVQTLHASSDQYIETFWNHHFSLLYLHLDFVVTIFEMSILVK